MKVGPSGRPVNVRLRSFSRSLPMALLLARESVMNRFRSSLHLFNITEQQWRVLRALSANDEMEAAALARATYLLPPSLSRILKDMERRGLIDRRVAPDDMRRSLISISAKGLKLMDAVAPYSESIYAEITETIGKDRMEMLLQLLKELSVSLDALPKPDYSKEQLDSDIAEIVGVPPRGRPRRPREKAGG